MTCAILGHKGAPTNTRHGQGLQREPTVHAVQIFHCTTGEKGKKLREMAAAILIRPTVIATLVHKCRTPNRIAGPRLLFNHSEKSYPKDRVFRCPNSMTEPTRIQAGNGGDEGIKALEREAFVNGSSKFAANGLEATLNNLSQWLFAGLFALFILCRHDVEALWSAMGSVINAVLSTALKRLLNQERPVANLRSDPGMPSSHAQSIFYIITLAVLSTVEWWGLNGFTTAISGLLFAFGSYFSWLRISQHLHTVSQVVVGAVLGTLFSALWFWSWEAIVLNAFASNLWVQILVILGGAAFCVGFFLYVIRYWIMEPVTLYISGKL